VPVYHWKRFHPTSSRRWPVSPASNETAAGRKNINLLSI
jgi:hypothetical protein